MITTGRLQWCHLLLCAVISAALLQPAFAAPELHAPMQSPTGQPCTLVADLTESDQLSAVGEITASTAQGLSKWYALHYRLLQLLADHVGCTLTVQVNPWSRSLALLRSGDVHLMLTVSHTKERESYADFIGPHYLEETVLVADKKYRTQIRQLADITRLPGPVAVLRDAWYGEEFAMLSQQPAFAAFLQYTNNLGQKLDLLKRGRAPAIVEERSQFLQWVELNPELNERYVIVLTLNRAPVYIVASRAGVPLALRQRLKSAWQSIYGGPAHLAILQEFGWKLE